MSSPSRPFTCEISRVACELIGLSTKTLRSIAPSSTRAASYLRPSSADFITNIAESDFRYRQGFGHGVKGRRVPEKGRGIPGPRPECHEAMRDREHWRRLNTGWRWVQPKRLQQIGNSSPSHVTAAARAKGRTARMVGDEDPKGPIQGLRRRRAQRHLRNAC